MLNRSRLRGPMVLAFVFFLLLWGGCPKKETSSSRSPDSPGPTAAAGTAHGRPGDTARPRPAASPRPEHHPALHADSNPYLAPRAAEGPRSGPAVAHSNPQSPWSSRADCEALVKAGQRMALAAGKVRVGTWNIRWFPDGGMGLRPHAVKATDIRWLACAIAWMKVDVLGIQEIKSHPQALSAIQKLLRRLKTLTGSTWKAQLDRCPGGTKQHVGILWNASRIKGSRFRDVAALNPHGGACRGRLRPGFGGYFKARGGVDFHLIVVHTKSGSDARSIGLRSKTLKGIVGAYRDAQKRARDRDVILAGDWNTMGCRKCTPKVANTEEIQNFGKTVSGLSVPFRRVGASSTCSEYYRGHGGLLDHFVVSKAMREVHARTKAHVSGYCGVAGCRRLSARKMPSAYTKLSDHCPLLLDIRNKDLD